jgi:hypothetical protein
MYTPQRYNQAIQWWYLQQYGVLSDTGEAPTATTQPATSVTATSATLNGVVSANGASTVVEFEYGTTSGSYTSTATATQSPVTGNSINVSASITLPGVTTYYRVKATNSEGTAYGTEQKVSTLIADLEAYWTLNEASGTRLDSAGVHNLSDTGGVGSSTGKLGNAAVFDGTMKYLSTPNDATLQTGDIDFTIAGWAYFTTLDANPIAAKRDSTDFEWQLYMTGAIGNELTFGINGASFIPVVASNYGTPSTGTWLFVVGWHDSAANTVNIQVNGGTVNSLTTGAVVPDATTAPLRVGNDGLTSYMNGRVDALGFWRRVLTTAERTALYGSGAGLAYPFI